MNIDKVSFGAMQVHSLPQKRRTSAPPLGRIDKIKNIVKKGMTIDKLPETGFVVGLLLPIPLTSIILPAIGIIIKYSYKSYRALAPQKNQRINKIV